MPLHAALETLCLPYNIHQDLDPAYLTDSRGNISRHPADFCRLNLARPTPAVGLLFISLIEDITVNYVYYHSSSQDSKLQEDATSVCFGPPKLSTCLLNISSYSPVTG